MMPSLSNTYTGLFCIDVTRFADLGTLSNTIASKLQGPSCGLVQSLQPWYGQPSWQWLYSITDDGTIC